MELYQLRTFVMVAEEGNLTRAAKRLHASQPAVSAHIKALEDELGVNLFTRTPKGMELTSGGRTLREQAGEILSAAVALEREAAKMRGALQGVLRIGINTASETLRIAELFQTMQHHYPDLDLHLRQATSGEVLEKLEQGELDAGFLFGALPSERIYAMELQRMELVVVGHPSLQAPFQKQIPEEFLTSAWIMTPDNCSWRPICSRFFQQLGFTPKQAALTDDESIIRTMVRNGAGLSFMLRQEAEAEGKTDRLAIWDHEPLPLPLFICCLHRRKDEPPLQTLFSVLSSLWEPPPSLSPSDDEHVHDRAHDHDHQL